MKKNGLLVALVFLLLSVSLSAQPQSVRMFIFGHSLIDHRPPAIPTPSDETTVPHWLFLLAQDGGHSYAAAGKYGFLPQHRQLPPFSQWGYDIVPPAWDSDTESFAEADINRVLITAGNFMQWQGPDQEYPTDPGVTPISATLEIMDWLELQGDDAKVYIYENWPDMAPYLSAGFPPSETDFQAYNAYAEGEFHDWWITYQDALLAARPEAQVRMIPVGPALSRLFRELLPAQIPLTELYEDDAPHGRPTLYFLAGLVTYMAIYGEPAPANFILPETVHPLVAEQYSAIVSFLWEELQSFRDADDVSRVFCINGGPVGTDDAIELSRWSVYPNPVIDVLQIESSLTEREVELLDAHGRLLQKVQMSESEMSIDMQALPSGMYLLRLLDTHHGTFSLQTVVKQ